MDSKKSTGANPSNRVPRKHRYEMKYFRSINEPLTSPDVNAANVHDLDANYNSVSGDTGWDLQSKKKSMNLENDWKLEYQKLNTPDAVDKRHGMTAAMKAMMLSPGSHNKLNTTPTIPPICSQSNGLGTVQPATASHSRSSRESLSGEAPTKGTNINGKDESDSFYPQYMESLILKANKRAENMLHGDYQLPGKTSNGQHSSHIALNHLNDTSLNLHCPSKESWQYGRGMETDKYTSQGIEAVILNATKKYEMLLAKENLSCVPTKPCEKPSTPIEKYMPSLLEKGCIKRRGQSTQLNPHSSLVDEATNSNSHNSTLSQQWEVNMNLQRQKDGEKTGQSKQTAQQMHTEFGPGASNSANTSSIDHLQQEAHNEQVDTCSNSQESKEAKHHDPIPPQPSSAAKCEQQASSVSRMPVILRDRGTIACLMPPFLVIHLSSGEPALFQSAEPLTDIKVDTPVEYVVHEYQLNHFKWLIERLIVEGKTIYSVHSEKFKLNSI